MDTARNKAVVEEFDRLGNRGGDLGRLDALCMPDMVNHALAPGRPPGWRGLDRRQAADLGFLVGAGEGNRTLMTSLEGWGSAIELRPRGPERHCLCICRLATRIVPAFRMEMLTGASGRRMCPRRSSHTIPGDARHAPDCRLVNTRPPVVE
jgi:hypothetical protein